eukprot:TRINITY_DN10791_c0_g1_i1.p2 TRINITY_DN10791_c0_g1~~TRINITY_DN10791_c0_g1_i1.p2  ORF type:complete len:221 (+),score=18.06 TRINITY_DN10791_c0_g1_i1:75-665(+)
MCIRDSPIGFHAFVNNSNPPFLANSPSPINAGPPSKKLRNTNVRNSGQNFAFNPTPPPVSPMSPAPPPAFINQVTSSVANGPGIAPYFAPPPPPLSSRPQTAMPPFLSARPSEAPPFSPIRNSTLPQFQPTGAPPPYNQFVTANQVFPPPGAPVLGQSIAVGARPMTRLSTPVAPGFAFAMGQPPQLGGTYVQRFG